MLDFVASKLSKPALYSHQKLAISKFIEGGKDIFINLPTGFGKFISFQVSVCFWRIDLFL